MKAIKISIFIISAFFAASLEASYTYTYTGNNFSYAGNTQPGEKAYDLTKKITFSFTTSQAVENMELGMPIFNEWTFSDGTQIVNSMNIVGLENFLLLVSASAAPGKVFEQWDIHLNYNLPLSSYPNFLNTTNRLNQFSQPLVYDWGQNELGNYGGNDDLPGTWAVTVVPEPEASVLLLAGICLGFTMCRKRKLLMTSHNFKESCSPQRSSRPSGSRC
jgi:hypothetical protein